MQRSLEGFDLYSELVIVLLAGLAGGLAVWVLVRALGPLAVSRLPASEQARDQLALGAIGIMVSAYLLTIGRLAVARHDALKSHAYDLGIFTQVLWNTAQGRPFQNTVMIEYAQNLLGQHFAPIFLLLVPLYWIWPDPRALLILQSVALAGGALPLYVLAQRRIGSRVAALLLAAAYLVTPALHFVNFYDFHEIALVTPLLLGALYFLDSGRMGRMLVCLGLALLCREEVSIIVAAFGLAMLLRRKWALGGALTALGAAWLYVTVVHAVPYFQESSVYYFVVRYGKLGDTIPQILSSIITRPLFVLEYLTTGDRAWDRLAYLVRLFGPAGVILPVLGLPFLLFSVPSFGYLLLSDYREQYDIVNQYSAPLLPFIYGAVAAGIGWLTRQRWMQWPAAPAALAGFVLVSGLAASYQYGPTPWGKKHDSEQFTATDHTRLAYQVFKLIPPGASVSTQSDLVPHLAHRQEIYVFPYLHNADYVLVDNWTDRWPLTTPQWDIARDEILANPMYQLEYVEDGYGLFKKVSPIPIQHQTKVSFLDKIEIVGYDLPSSAKPGETVEVGIYWRAVTPIGVRRIRDRFVTFLHLVTPDGKPLVQVDTEPMGGITQTDRWIQGEIHRERYRVTLPSTLAAGDYGFDAGMYSFYSKRRLAVHDSRGQRTEQFAVRLADIRITGSGGVVVPAGPAPSLSRFAE